MTVEEVLQQLEAIGSEQTKQTLMRHGAMEPIYGVRIGDMKMLVKVVKRDQELAEALYETNNYDAMYLAGLTVNPKTISKQKLQEWVKAAYCYGLAEHTVANITAECPYAMELAREWIESDEELVAACGWSVYANYLTITPDELLDPEEIRRLLMRVETTIHQEKNRVRYAMNSFVICVGSYVIALYDEAMAIGERIGTVNVFMGQTACKVPVATHYVEKVLVSGKLGVKKKTCIC